MKPPPPVTRALIARSRPVKGWTFPLSTRCAWKLAHNALPSPQPTSASSSAALDVTVVVPAWGDYAGEPLGEALDSLQTQDLPARIIVVDNASEPALAVPAGVEVVRSAERLSVGAARKLGLELF